MNKTKIGETLTALRKERGETLADVANAVGICQSAVSMYERGERIPRDYIKENLAEHFGVPISQIFFAD